MGYNTTYRLETQQRVSHALVDVLGEPGPDFVRWMAENRNEGYDVFEGEPCKWYDHEKDMLAMSKAFPGYLFILHGEGEEAGDLWRKYFLNGRKQIAKAKISYDEPTL